MKIVTARLALISIGRIYGGEIFKKSIFDIIICQNFIFCKMYHISYQDFDFALISISYLYGNSRHSIRGYLTPDRLQLIDWSNLIDQNLGKIYGASCKIWILTDYYVRNGIFEDFPPIDSSNSNESHTGSDNFHCPFGSKNPKKAKRKTYLMLKNGPLPQLLDKHIKFANGCFEEKLEPNGQSTAGLALVLGKMKKSPFQ